MTLLSASVLLLTMPAVCGAQDLDSTIAAALDSKLEEYFKTLQAESIEVKTAECDILIEAADDPAVKRHIATETYAYYKDSPVMGDEAVAIHVFDKWFDSGLIDAGDLFLIEAKIFADFNRQSLLNMQAPEMELLDPEGNIHKVGNPSGRFHVLYFYDTGCAKCRLQTILLQSLLRRNGHHFDISAIYTGIDERQWAEWREKGLASTDAVRVEHFWDPELDSDYQRKYGVISTPRIFLLDPDGIIIGRRLDADALEQLLDAYAANSFYEYGEADAMALIDNLFSTYAEKRPGNVLSVAKSIEDRTLAKNDTLSFKRLEGDLLYWLTSQRAEWAKEGSLAFIKDYITGRPEIWNSSDDTLRIIGLSNMMNELLSRMPIGSKLPKIKELAAMASSGMAAEEPAAQEDTAAKLTAKDIKALLPDWNRVRRKGGLFIFHTEGCPVCREEISAAEAKGLDYVDINVDEIRASQPALGTALLDAFDLSGLPFILSTGRGGIIERRYMSLL